jgi:hypothetical protein
MQITKSTIPSYHSVSLLITGEFKCTIKFIKFMFACLSCYAFRLLTIVKKKMLHNCQVAFELKIRVVDCQLSPVVH